MEEKKFNREEEEKDTSIYHEKQRLQFCLLHALNNLLQERDSFTRSELDAIAEKLVRDDPERSNWAAKPLSLVFRSHHNAITGNYDVNVLIAALESREKTVSWHDRRGGAASIFGAENILGVVVNAPVRRLGGLWRGRHWIALRRIGRLWYNLDSDLKEPAPFDDADALIGFLDGVIGRGGEVLIVSNGDGSDVEAAAEAEAENFNMGKLGEVMVAMLPDDLAFTLFVPSEMAFKRVLRMTAAEGLIKEKANDTFAVLSRLMGFSAVPRHLPSEAAPVDGEVCVDSVSGFGLCVWKDLDGKLVVNNVKSVKVDGRRGEIIVHVMDGVIMDAQFEQSFGLDDDDDGDGDGGVRQQKLI